MKLSKRQITADKREIKDFPKLPSATSFIRKTLCAIRKPAFVGAKGDRNFMMLLPSFNGEERRTGKEIPISRDNLIKGVKRLTPFDPNFFLLVRRGVPIDEKY